MANEKLTVLIIGGGIGGLVAAISLAQDGHDVTVIEHKSRYDIDGGESGQGLCLTVNA
ncbi:UNVERIFIED_CONTAM: FAD-dependent oxidoreductase, partial [Bacteroidetes bacterium 56_B9]